MTAQTDDAERLKQQASAHWRAGRTAEALDVMRSFLKLQPAHPQGLAFAGMLAMDEGEAAEAAALLERAVALIPDRPELQFNLGIALEAANKPDQALSAFETAARLNPAMAEAHYKRGLALHAKGRLADAVDAYEQAHAAGFTKPDLYANSVRALWKLGNAPSVANACLPWLEVEPRSVEAFSHLALASHEAGDQVTAGALLDFDRLVQVHDLDPPPGWPDMAAFNRALADHVTAHPTMAVPPDDHPTYHNPHLHVTEELLDDDPGPMADLKDLFVAAIERYLATVPRFPPHPFLERWPKQWRLAAWATLLNGQGNLLPHIHFEGYLGGVYYPELPDEVYAASDSKAGWFELGRPPEEFALTAQPAVRAYQPRPGRLLLFPGYFYHCTVPFTSTQRRISIAFDVVPEG